MKYVLSVFILGTAFALHSENFTLSSTSFKNAGEIPAKFAMKKIAGGINVSPQLSWKGIPEGTKSLAITCIDLHPVAKSWVHWMVVNIPTNKDSLPEGASGGKMPKGTIELENSFGDIGWGGPQPPPGTGKHEYLLMVYALNIEKVNTGTTSLTEKEFLNVIKGNILAKAEIRGYFSR